MNNELRTRLEKEPWGSHIALWFYVKDRDGLSISSNLTMEKVSDGEIVTQPPIRLSMVVGQELIDQLWQAGLRPSEGSGSAGSLKATERHLEDMRRLVFKDSAL
jgi:hypothetical protein